MTTFKLVEYQQRVREVLIRVVSHLENVLHITEAESFFIPWSLEDEPLKISITVPPEQFPWDYEKVECFSVNTYQCQASMRTKITDRDVIILMSTTVGFNMLPSMKQIPSEVLRLIAAEIRQDFDRSENNIAQEPDLQVRAWKSADPRHLTLKKHLEIIEYHAKLRA